MNWQRIVCQIFGHEDDTTFWLAYCKYCGQYSPEWVQELTPKTFDAFIEVFTKAVNETWAAIQMALREVIDSLAEFGAALDDNR